MFRVDGEAALIRYDVVSVLFHVTEAVATAGAFRVLTKARLHANGRLERECSSHDFRSYRQSPGA